MGCFMPDGVDGQSAPVIYADFSTGPFTLQHEQGHAYDALLLDDGERARIEDVLGWPTWRPEAFANLYAGCALGLRPDEAPWPYPEKLKVHRINAVCRLVARAGDTPG